MFLLLYHPVAAENHFFILVRFRVCNHRLIWNAVCFVRMDRPTDMKCGTNITRFFFGPSASLSSRILITFTLDLYCILPNGRFLDRILVARTHMTPLVRTLSDNFINNKMSDCVNNYRFNNFVISFFFS